MVQNCDATGFVAVQAVSETTVLFELMQETVRDWVEFAHVFQAPVCQVAVVVDTTTVPHLLTIAARVLGPMAPYPVVAGAPLDAIPCCDCHRCTALSVSMPKKPVEESLFNSPCVMRNCWSCVTSLPREPRKRFRTRFGHEVALDCGVAGTDIDVCAGNAPICATSACICTWGSAMIATDEKPRSTRTARPREAIKPFFTISL